MAKEILIKIAAKSQGKILNLYIAFYFKGTGFFLGGGGGEWRGDRRAIIKVSRQRI